MVLDFAEAEIMVGKVKLNNGIEMPMEGFGVFQIPEDTANRWSETPLQRDTG